MGLTVDGADETHTDNDAPYVFRVLGDAPAGEYTLRATPYSANDLGGVSGEPLVVSFSIGDEPVVRSSDATLLELELNGVDLDVKPGITEYETAVGPQVARTTVSAAAASGATYAIGPDDADANADGHQMDLAVGMNTLEILVTAEDGEARRNYTVQVVRAPFVTGP
ncbi:MAG: cadherin-like beta sandwich domain-containing protein [Gammaproteobacteria bacterium]|nr:cadherin-like beta sandwich domain-containing protein [Gammaproteobacteria bacterium]